MDTCFLSGRAKQSLKKAPYVKYACPVFVRPRTGPDSTGQTRTGTGQSRTWTGQSCHIKIKWVLEAKPDKNRTGFFYKYLIIIIIIIIRTKYVIWCIRARARGQMTSGPRGPRSGLNKKRSHLINATLASKS